MPLQADSMSLRLRKRLHATVVTVDTYSEAGEADQSRCTPYALPLGCPFSPFSLGELLLILQNPIDTISVRPFPTGPGRIGFSLQGLEEQGQTSLHLSALS